MRDWTMAVLMFVFVLLYGAVLIGWLRPLPGEQMAARLEPIIFVFLGYYFSRLPSLRSEATLKEEVNRQSQKADAAQHAKEQMQQARETLEEKMKNVRAVLTSSASGEPQRSRRDQSNCADDRASGQAVRHSVAVALNILNS